MPNGGVPIHMVLRVSKAGPVIWCEGQEVRALARRLEDKKGKADPSFSLSRDEALVLSRFLTYWQDGAATAGPIYKRIGVDVEFDF